MIPLKITPWALAARSIKRELKIAFPEMKFSVKSQSYAHGNNVRVSWKGLLNRHEVENIIAKYEHGSFNPSDDLYTYKYTAFHKEFGSAKYVFATQNYTDINQNEDLESKPQ